MRILHLPSHDDQPGNIALLFGRGLLGSAVEQRLLKLCFRPFVEMQSPWPETRAFRHHLDEALAYLMQLAGENTSELHCIWTAGSGGFSSSWEDLDTERRAFDEITDWLHGMEQSDSAVFHYVSSAGGLFEGQVLADARSTPDPRRPYGKMKCEQEARLFDMFGGGPARIRVYRPSTVYGPHRYRRRAGLISHMLWNAIYGSPVVLERKLHTLRDYICVDDVAEFMGAMVGSPGVDLNGVYHLVSARPASIAEVKLHVERLLARQLNFCLTSAAGNDADITFSPSLRPDGWSTTPLEQGLRRVYRETMLTFRRENPAQMRLVIDR